MVKPLYCCLFLPVTLLAALCTDTRINFKFVCIGDSVEVFQNIISTSFKEAFTLYKTFAGKKEAIAMWIMQNFGNTFIVHDIFEQRLSLENGTILLQDFQASDEAEYTVLYEVKSKTKVVTLCALYPPTQRCKPSIKLQGNLLIASLDHPEDCGKHVPSVRWMEFPGVSYSSGTVLELPPGGAAGTYMACIEAECVKHSFERTICESFTIGSASGNNVPQVSNIVRALYPLIKNIAYEAVGTAVNMTVGQLKDVVVKPIVESNDKQLAHLEEMYTKILDEKRTVIDEKQTLINEKEVLLKSKDTTIKSLESTMEQLKASFDDLEENGLRSSIRLNNVKLGNNESCEEKVVDVIINMANVSISRDDIERCHPLGKPNTNGNRQLMIIFKSYKTKVKVFSQRKNMKGNVLGIYMTEDTNRLKPDLLNKLLKYKTSKHIDDFWIVDGKIYARKYPGSYPKRINTMQDIEHLLVNDESSLFANNHEKH